MSFGEALAIAALMLVIAGTALLVDPGAYASFDAPKRLVALFGVSLAAFAVFGSNRGSTWSETWRVARLSGRLALFAATVALVWAAFSALLSPRRPASLESFRVVLLYSLLIPLGASGAVARGRKALLGTFLGATAVNSVVSLLQTGGIRLFRLETLGTRNETGALAGNVGYLMLAVSFAGVLSLGVSLTTRSSLVRAVALIGLLLFLAALLANRNLTAVVSLAVGGIALVLALFGRRSLAPIAAVAVVLFAALWLVPPLRQRSREAWSAVRARDWDQLTTYRTGAWAAAVEMARERPLAGWGPGTYEAEFVPHRLKAEIRARRRFVNPLVTSSYSEAHCDYLQAFAETGWTGGFAALVAAGALLATAGRRFHASRHSRSEAAVLFGLLVAGAAAALTWFPLQRPISAVPLLLAAGRSWRIGAPATEESDLR